AGDVVVCGDAGEDPDRRLELFGDNDIRAEPAELGDFRHVTGARDDVDAGVGSASHAHHTAGRRRVGDRNHEHAGALRAEGAQDLFTGGIAIEGGLAARAGLLDGLRVELDDEVRRPDGPQRGGQVAPVQGYPATIT